MTGGSFVFFHPAVKNSELSCDFSPPGEYLILNLTLTKEQRTLALNIVVKIALMTTNNLFKVDHLLN